MEMGQEKVTGKKQRIESEDHSAVTITDSLGVTWVRPSQHTLCFQEPLFVRSWDQVSVCVTSTLLMVSPFHE